MAMFFGVLPSSGFVQLKLWSDNFNPKITRSKDDSAV